MSPAGRYWQRAVAAQVLQRAALSFAEFNQRLYIRPNQALPAVETAAGEIKLVNRYRHSVSQQVPDWANYWAPASVITVGINAEQGGALAVLHLKPVTELVLS